jgi:class 3 adenylate cyclase
MSKYKIEEYLEEARISLSMGNMNEAIIHAQKVFEIEIENEKNGIESLLILSEACWRSMQNDKAMNYANQALHKAKNSINKQIHLVLPEIYACIANIEINYGGLENALQYINQGFELVQEDNYCCNIHLNAVLGRYWMYKQEFNFAREYFNKALILAKKLGKSTEISRIAGALATIAARTSDLSIALEYAILSLEHAEKTGNKKDCATIMGNIGNIYSAFSDYQKALEYYSGALAIDEELQSYNGIARHLLTIGVTHEKLENYNTALYYFEKAYSYYMKIDNKEGLATLNLNTGAVYAAMEQKDRALEYYKKSAAYFDAQNNRVALAASNLNIGIMYNEMNEYEKSMEYLYSALSLFENLNDISGAARTKGYIGSVLLKSEYSECDRFKGEEYLIDAIQKLEIVGVKMETYRLYNTLSEYYEKTEQWQKSLYAYQQYHTLEKEVQNEELQKNARIKDFEWRNREREHQLQSEKIRNEEQAKLINNILPPDIALRLMGNETYIADFYESVSVLFMDIVNFTVLSAKLDPNTLIAVLDTIFTKTDGIIRQFGLEKIKTIGDAYMAVAGAPQKNHLHAIAAAQAALSLKEYMKNIMPEIIRIIPEHQQFSMPALNVRIGIHCGEAVAGIVGINKFSYDLWGDTVNTASRMESHGEPGRIHVSEEFAQNLAQNLSQGEGFSFPFGEGRDGVSFSFPLGEGWDGVLIPRGEIEIKGKGRMKTYFLEKA